MDQVSFNEMKLKDILKDILSFNFSESVAILCKGQFKRQFVL